MEKMVSVVRQCPFCSKIYSVEVPAKGFVDWQDGALIQNAMPNVSSTIRESLISGMCEKCQSKFFGDWD